MSAVLQGQAPLRLCAAPAPLFAQDTVGVTYASGALEALPVGRTINAATLLAPGVTDNGPNSNITISGALSFENLFLINGVVVNDHQVGQQLFQRIVPMYEYTLGGPILRDEIWFFTAGRFENREEDVDRVRPERPASQGSRVAVVGAEPGLRDPALERHVPLRAARRPA